MMEFMRAGGFSMWPILALGVTALGMAGFFLRKPGESLRTRLRAISAALVFATLTGVFSDIGATMKTVTTVPEFSQSPRLHLLVMTGLGESMAPAILGFGILTVVWVLVSAAPAVRA